MKKLFVYLVLMLVPVLVFGQDPFFEVPEVDGVDAQDSPFEYGVKFAAFLIYLALLLGIGVYIVKTVWGMVAAHNSMMNSRNADGSNDNTKTTGNIGHLAIAVVLFIIIMSMWEKIDTEIDELFAINISIDGTDLQMEKIKRSA